MQELIFVNKDTLKQIKESIRIFGRKWNKIVASTDESLTTCPNKVFEQGCCHKPDFCEVPQKTIARPSNEFLKAYCEQGGIDEVLIEYTNHEQETGEFAHTDEELTPYIKTAPDNTITIHPVKQKESQS